LKYVSPLAEARMPKHVCVPKRMQLARVSATIGCSKKISCSGRLKQFV
jgi:hypothetical protein